ncbi:MAG: hypothetical protein M3T49_06350 [Candidatus Eremiobacteraeota bacterium]|nr:hypothetical protein [Candidatus Eremiobacteraeota bacterium]
MKAALACLAIVALCACSNGERAGKSGGEGPQPAAMASNAGAHLAAAPLGKGAVSARLAAMHGSHQSGLASLSPKGNRTQVSIMLLGEPAKAKQPAHIHAGSCAKLNAAPKYPLHDVVAGRSTTLVDAPLSDLRADRYAVNVHASAADLTKYVSCGDIPR